MGKPYWLWTAIPFALLAGAVVALRPSAPVAPPATFSQPAVSAKDGVYVLAQEHFGPIKAAVLVVNGDKGEWYRNAIATSTDRETASLDLGRPAPVAVFWEGEPEGQRMFGTAAVMLKADDAGRLSLKIDNSGRGEAPHEEFVLKRTNLTEPPRTLKELLDAYGPPQVIP